jgi:hypothetical protein
MVRRPFPCHLNQSDSSTGWSYEYLSPDNLIAEPEAYVADGVFAPTRQAFKALVLRGNDTLTIAGVDKLTQYAHEGLPIIISGGTPCNLSGYNASGTAYVKSALAALTNLDNVQQVPAENLSASLQSLGLTPRTRVDADRIWYTYWREDKQAAKTYVFVYNDAWDSELGLGSSNGSVTYETTGVPYFYDAWTGETNPIFDFHQTKECTTIPLILAGNQSTIIGFHHNETTPCYYSKKTNHPANPLQSHRPPRSSHPLSPWTLTIESWTAPPNLTTSQTQSTRTNSTHHLPSLLPWNIISTSLTNVSGRGFYNTTFTWPLSSDHNARGVVLDLGTIINTARVWINGQRLPPLDPTHAVADISKFLREGENEVVVVVATTLGNAVRTVWGELRSSGTLALGPLPAMQEYGLVGEVVVREY